MLFPDSSTIMLSKFAVLCCALMLYACASSDPVVNEPASPPSAEEKTLKAESPDSAQSNYWLTVPQSGKLIIVGVTGVQQKRETEIAAAREDAARKIAMYHGVRAVSEHVQSVGSGFLDYYVDSATSMEYDQEIEKYIDQLTYDPERDVLKFDNVICIRFSYPVNFPGGDINYSFERNHNGRPEWTFRPPQEINGLNVGVGFARRQSRMRDTIVKSYESAVAALVTSLSAKVTANVTSAENQNSSRHHQTSEGHLANFLVLETWIEPDTRAVWTLAVAKTTEIKE